MSTIIGFKNHIIKFDTKKKPRTIDLFCTFPFKSQQEVGQLSSTRSLKTV